VTAPSGTRQAQHEFIPSSHNNAQNAERLRQASDHLSKQGSSCPQTTEKRAQLHPGVTEDDIRAKTGAPFEVALKQ
jgi:hypothetical protein